MTIKKHIGFVPQYQRGEIIEGGGYYFHEVIICLDKSIHRIYQDSHTT